MSKEVKFVKHDLMNDYHALPDVLGNAARQGIWDEAEGVKGDKTGKELARLLCTDWMRGHERAIRAAYSNGRWSVMVSKEKAAGRV